jgi:predicted DNA-binding ribbon-helix-helix protein
MKSKIIQHTIKVGDRKTSISIEDDFWNSLKEIANQRGETLIHLLSNINAERKTANLSSAVRLFVVGFYRDQFNSGSKPVDLPADEARPAA